MYGWANCAANYSFPSTKQQSTINLFGFLLLLLDWEKEKFEICICSIPKMTVVFFRNMFTPKNICLSSQLPLRANYLLEREDGKAINYQLFSHVHSKSDCPCKRLFLRTCLFPFLVVNCFGWSCESFVVKYAKVFAGWSMFSGNNIVRVIY